MNLSGWTLLRGVRFRTRYGWFWEGMLPAARRPRRADGGGRVPGRLRWTNTEPVKPALWAHGRHLVVLDDGEAGDPVRDLVEVLTSFCCPSLWSSVGAELGVEDGWLRSAQRRPLVVIGAGRRDAGHE
jgi:hypothetical protein